MRTNPSTGPPVRALPPKLSTHSKAQKLRVNLHERPGVIIFSS